MKKLFLLRHAKSDWKEKNLTDFDRILSKKGKKDAPFMAALLHKQNFKPELIVTSPALRALSTAHYFLDEYGYELDRLKIVNELYLASPGRILDVITSIDDRYNSIMITGHNPGITEINNILSSHFIMDFPTCGTSGMVNDIGSWTEAASKKWTNIFFEYPKKYLTE